MTVYLCLNVEGELELWHGTAAGYWRKYLTTVMGRDVWGLPDPTKPRWVIDSWDE